MELIEQALQYAAAKRKKFALIWILLGYVVIMVVVLSRVNSQGKVVTAFVFAMLTLITIVLHQVKFRNSHKEFTETPVFKALDQLGYSQEFLSTIDLELRHDLRLKYSDGIYGLTMFVTKTWFLLISKNGSIIRKFTDIARIYEGFAPNSSRHYLVIDFIDGSYFTNTCDCDELIELMQQEFPMITYEPSENEEHD